MNTPTHQQLDDHGVRLSARQLDALARIARVYSDTDLTIYPQQRHAGRSGRLVTILTVRAEVRPDHAAGPDHRYVIGGGTIRAASEAARDMARMNRSLR